MKRRDQKSLNWNAGKMKKMLAWNHFGAFFVFFYKFLLLRFPPFCASHPNLWRIALHQFWRTLQCPNEIYFLSGRCSLQLMISPQEIHIIKKFTVFADQLPVHPHFLRNAQGSEVNFVICIENTFWKKNGPKRPFQPSAVVRPKMTRLYEVAGTN